MKKLLVIMLVTLCSPSIYAQSNDAVYKIGVRQISVEENKAFLDLSDAQFKEIKGSPYDSNIFFSGNIFRDDQLIEKKVFLRYNAYSDEMEIKKSSKDKEYNALVKNSSVIIEIGNDVYVLIPYEGSDERGSYFKIISTDKYLDLYKKSSVTYTPRTLAKTSYDREKPAKFTRTDTYYLMSKDGNFVEMPQNKSKLLKIMNNKKSDIKAFMKENKLNLKDEIDLIKLVKFYNSLL